MLATSPFVPHIGAYSFVHTFWGQWHFLMSFNASKSEVKLKPKRLLIKRRNKIKSVNSYNHYICNCVAVVDIHFQINKTGFLAFRTPVYIYLNNHSYKRLDPLVVRTNSNLALREILRKKYNNTFFGSILYYVFLWNCNEK